tara:strand:+ start:1499 stop:2050 length:552 start_codon:yes stop_codon:yes gene_type:complete
MGTIFVDNLEPQSGTSLTLGASGDTVSLTSGAKTSGFGKIGQVVSTFKNDTFGTSSSSLVDITGFSASITPSTTSSKILIYVCGGVSSGTGGHNVLLSLLRGSTEIGQGTGGGTSNNFMMTNMAANSDVILFGHHFLDSPSTTSSTTYKMQMASTSGTAQLNRRADTSVRTMSSSITLMEILD